jgi:hypothetical protein
MKFFSTRNLRKGKQQFMQQRLKNIEQNIKSKGAVPKDYSKSKSAIIFVQKSKKQVN